MLVLTTGIMACGFALTFTGFLMLACVRLILKRYVFIFSPEVLKEDKDLSELEGKQLLATKKPVNTDYLEPRWKCFVGNCSH
jgi:hypothetical protein